MSLDRTSQEGTVITIALGQRGKWRKVSSKTSLISTGMGRIWGNVVSGHKIERPDMPIGEDKI